MNYGRNFFLPEFVHSYTYIAEDTKAAVASVKEVVSQSTKDHTIITAKEALHVVGRIH